MIGCIIQARLGSTRFPRKILMPVNNDTILSFGIKQIQKSDLIEKFVVATTTMPEDDELVNYLENMNVEIFRGSETDVLDRYYQCAKKFSFSTIIRMTSDCPLVDPLLVNNLLDDFIKNKDSYDYASNVHPVRTFPHGADIEIFSFESLEIAWKEAQTKEEREHVTPYIYNTKKFRLLNPKNPENLSHYRWTLDYKDDLDLIQKIVSKINSRPILLNDIITLMNSNPELVKINQNFQKNEHEK